MKPTQDFDPSDVFYDLLDLAHMLDAIRLLISEMDFKGTRGTRNEDLDRVYALVKVAHREADRMADVAQVFDGPATWAPIKNKELQNHG